MRRIFELFDEPRDIVQGKFGLEITEIADRYLEGLPAGRDAPIARPRERLVDDLAERAAGKARFHLELCCHIVVHAESRSHALMR